MVRMCSRGDYRPVVIVHGSTDVYTVHNLQVYQHQVNRCTVCDHCQLASQLCCRIEAGVT